MSLLKFYKPYKKMLVFVIAGSLISAGVEITFPMIVRHILGTVLPARDMDGLWREGGLLFALYCVCLVVTYLVYRCGRNMGVYIENDLRRSLFRHLESLDFAFFDGTKTGQLVSRVTGDISEIGNIVFQLPNLVMVCIVMMGGSAFFLFYINRVLAACVLFLVALKTADTVFLNRKMKNAFAETRRRMGTLSSVTTEILGAIRVVKAYNGEKEALRNFSEAAVELIREQQETFRYQAYLSGTVVFFSNAINLAIIVIGSVLIMNGLLAISDLVAFLMYLMLFIRPIMQLTVLTEQYQRSMAGFRRYEELMALVPDVRDGELILNKEDVCGDIRFEHVCFAYDGDTPVLHDFNLHIRSGETVALVGGPPPRGKQKKLLFFRSFFLCKGGGSFWTARIFAAIPWNRCGAISALCSRRRICFRIPLPTIYVSGRTMPVWKKSYVPPNGPEPINLSVSSLTAMTALSVNGA